MTNQKETRREGERGVRIKRVCGNAMGGFFTLENIRISLCHLLPGASKGGTFRLAYNAWGRR